MKRGIRIGLAVLMIASVIALGLTGCAKEEAPAPVTPTPVTPTPVTPAPAEEVTLRYGDAWPQNSVMNIPAIWFMDEIEARTKGRITFERYFNTTIIKGGEELDAIKDRVVDFGIPGPWYYAGRMYLQVALRQIPFGVADYTTFINVFDKMCEAMPEFRNDIERYNQKILFYYPVGNYEIYSSTPIKTLEDFKGKKLACIGLLGRFVDILGATPVPSPMAERYMNLQTGAEDGGLLPFSVMLQYKYEELCKYFTYAGLGYSHGCPVTINNDTWNELSKADQDLFLEVSAIMRDKAAELLNAEDEGAVAFFEEKGVEFFTLSDADRARWADLLPNLPKEYAAELEAKGLPGNKVYDLYFKFAKEEGWEFYRDWWAE